MHSYKNLSLNVNYTFYITPPDTTPKWSKIHAGWKSYMVYIIASLLKELLRRINKLFEIQVCYQVFFSFLWVKIQNR